MSRLFLKCVTKSLLLRVNYQSLQIFYLLINKNNYVIQMYNFIEFQNKGLYSWKGRIISNLQNIITERTLRNMKILFFLLVTFFQEAMPAEINWKIIEPIVYRENYFTFHIEDTTKVEHTFFYLALL